MREDNVLPNVRIHDIAQRILLGDNLSNGQWITVSPRWDYAQTFVEHTRTLVHTFTYTCTVHFKKYTHDPRFVVYRCGLVSASFAHILQATSSASCQIRKIVGCASAGNTGNVFPATAV